MAKIKLSGRKLCTTGRKLSVCGCGGETGPFPWPTGTDIWLVGSPCSWAGNTDKPIIARASNIASSPAYSGGTLPYPCSAGSAYNATAGRQVCAVFRYNGPTLVLTESEWGTGNYYPVTSIDWGWTPRECCTCSDSIGGPCDSMAYGPNPFAFPDNLPDGIAITISIPKTKGSWNPLSSACEYRCCCSMPGNGQTQTRTVTATFTARADYADGSYVSTTYTYNISGTFYTTDDVLAGTEVRTTTTYYATANPPYTETGTVTNEVGLTWPSCGSWLKALVADVYGGNPNATGTFVLACGSSSYNAAWDYNEGGTHYYGTASGSETITSSGTCAAECNNAAPCPGGASILDELDQALFS
jgi:hypothetical protein